MRYIRKVETTPLPPSNYRSIIDSLNTSDNKQTNAPSINAVLEGFRNMIYPVGSIYMSANNINPGTFLPDTTWVSWGSGRVPVGVNTNDSDFNDVEKTGGSKTRTLTIAQLPAHTHLYVKPNSNTGSANGNTGSTILTVAQLPAHKHTYSKSNSTTGSANGNTGSTVLTVNQIPVHSHEATAGTGSAENYFVVFTKNNKDPLYGSGFTTTSGSGTWNTYGKPFASSTANEGGGQGHTHSLNNHKHNISTTTSDSSSVGSGQGHTHSLNNHTHSISTTSSSTGSTGDNQALNILQPYITCYMWKRIS